jgi:hypothetical protein
MKHTMEQADELVMDTTYADRIEDYEYQPEGDLHVYTLDDGSPVLGPMGCIWSMKRPASVERRRCCRLAPTSPSSNTIPSPVVRPAAGDFFISPRANVPAARTPNSPPGKSLARNPTVVILDPRSSVTSMLTSTGNTCR